ncbi:DUF2157 domain-containing protein [Pseudomonas sp. N040]|uniref:DUF2157 domain-containing protein n=1 Tax=Pseudomonas sp. N040 TaxID=2785325 RepID=UPI0018A2B2B9|nr:DUF2157 domain-containing protein [Pseudomonas sp. N040]MBF7730667.1 DUF2157 domain-containing protein [Pseudomonas sp. N040]MBW7014310.1 DUF2157 domain-containing protein [Pseudomonas sp. N040]
MPVSNRSDAQQRADDIGVFNRELDRLQAEQVLQLSPQQQADLRSHQQALLARYRSAFDIDQNRQARQLSLGMRIASFLGALALAASVFFLFYQFWGLFGETVQTVLLLAASLLTFGLTLWVQARDSSGYFSKLAALVAFACFVLNIAMLGQIFNITPSDKALLPWAAYALLLAYATQARLLLAAGILCVLAFIAARVGTWGGIYWLGFGERPENFLPAGWLIFSVPLLIGQQRFDGFAVVYRVFGLLALFLPILVLANWGDASYFDYPASRIEAAYQLLGFAAAAAVIWLGIRRDWTDVVNTGLTFFVIFLYTKLFDWWWASMPKYLFFLLLGLTAVLILLILRRLRRTNGLLGGTAQ